MKFVLACVVLTCWIGSSCHGSPTDGVKRSVSDDERAPTEAEKKARCLWSLLGLNSYIPALPDFGGGSDDGLGGLQGGALSNSNPGFYGAGNSGVFGSSSGGLGFPSQYTPGLGQASSALQNSQSMENQLFAQQSLINSQLGGVPGSGIPLSPSFLRGGRGGVYGVRDLPAPPTLIYT